VGFFVGWDQMTQACNASAPFAAEDLLENVLLRYRWSGSDHQRHNCPPLGSQVSLFRENPKRRPALLIGQQWGAIGPVLADYFSCADLSVPISRASRKSVSGQSINLDSFLNASAFIITNLSAPLTSVVTDPLATVIGPLSDPRPLSSKPLSHARRPLLLGRGRGSS